MPPRIGPVLALLLLRALPLFAAELRDLQPTLVDGRVEVSFQLAGAIDDGVMARIESGLPTAFVYEVELVRDRKRWWDDEVAEATLEVVAMYNARLAGVPRQLQARRQAGRSRGWRAAGPSSSRR